MIQHFAQQPGTRARRRAASALMPLLALALAACGGPDSGGDRAADAAISPGASDPAAAHDGVEEPGPAAGAPAAPTLPAADGRAAVFTRGAGDGDKVVALTFNADMAPEHATRAAGGERFDNPRLVSSLRKLKVPATIFMTGRWADEYPDQARSLGRDPLFEVGNHSYGLRSFSGPCRTGMPRVDRGAMRDDVNRAYTAIRRAGVPAPVPYFRFPGGCFDDGALKAVAPARVTAVQGDVLSGDASTDSPDRVAEQVLSQVRPGSVVVMHATLSHAPATEAAVRRIVPELRAQGYRFVRVSELISRTRGEDRDQNSREQAAQDQAREQTGQEQGQAQVARNEQQEREPGRGQDQLPGRARE
ncbi:polysaccharide deacetylase family protein [Streptomyces sp. NPDC047108]|uniref:polysaccharide deacetylase family protein n=1 Tax=Streptomyces sp. NPDC047108 TaxID=3155025 RepID=UPI0033FAF3BE